MVRPRVQQSLGDVAIMPAFCEPILEHCARHFRDVIVLIEVAKIDVFRDSIFGKDFIEFVIRTLVEIRIIHVQRFHAVTFAPLALAGEQMQETPQQISSDTEVFDIIFLACVPPTQYDEVIT